MNRDELLKLDKEELLDLLLSIINQQAAKIAELEARLNQNSKNSSKPPSSDGFNKPPKSLRKPSGRKPGGQKGHEGSCFSQLGTPDQYVSHEPEACRRCPGYGTCQATRFTGETRYEVDIDLATRTTAHQALWVECPASAERLSGSFPDGINSTMQYGANLNALVVSLNAVGMVSINRTHEILGGVFGIPISTGTISAMVGSCADKVEGTVLEIKEALLQEPVIHADETGTNVNGKTAWAHVASTGKLTHIEVNARRGKEGMDEIGILPNYRGKAIHDCWASYFLYLLMGHGLCNAHLLRELIAVSENTRQAWAQKLIDLLLSMKQKKEELLFQDVWEALPGSWEAYSLAYDRILEEALAQNPVLQPDAKKKGRPKRGKTGALVDRLILRKEQYLLFFTDFTVPFDNNQAERDIRMFKVKQKVSGCFRTMDGAKDFATISSFVGTARKMGISAFHAIKDALIGKPFHVGSLSTD
jgi:transposase